MAVVKTESGLYSSTIDGFLYEFEKWGADSALETLMDLSSVLGKPIGALLAATGGKTDVELNAEALDTTLDAMSSAMLVNRDNVLVTIRKLCSRGVLCDHKQVGSFDLHYKGRLGHMFRVVRANLEVQYGDFLSELGITAQQLSKLAAAKRTPSSPTASPAVPTPA